MAPRSRTRCRVIGLLKEGDHCVGVRVGGLEEAAAGDEEFEIRAKVVINACGIFADEVRRMDEPECDSVIEPAQGVHLVLDRSFQPSETAIMVPHTDDGRVLFVIPWHGRVVVGTTDTPMPVRGSRAAGASRTRWSSSCGTRIAISRRDPSRTPT